MQNNQYNRFYSKKSVEGLIKQLREHKITGPRLDKVWYEALIVHFSERELSDEERKLIDHILNTEPDVLRNEEMMEEKRSSTQSNLNGTIKYQVLNETDRYPALRTIAGFYTAFAVVIGIAALVIAFFIGATSENSLIFITLTLVIGGLLVLGVLAISESIKVIIDIEHNTRQTANKK